MKSQNNTKTTQNNCLSFIMLDFLANLLKSRELKFKKKDKKRQYKSTAIFYGEPQNIEDKSYFDVTPNLTICLDKSPGRQQHILRPGGACTSSIRRDEPTQSLSRLSCRNFSSNPQLYLILSFIIASSHWSYFYMILLVSSCQTPSYTHRYLINASA